MLWRVTLLATAVYPAIFPKLFPVDSLDEYSWVSVLWMEALAAWEGTGVRGSRPCTGIL